jgi:phage tail-like protein
MRDVNNTEFKLVLGRSDWLDQFGVGATDGGERPAGAATRVLYDAERRCASLPAQTDRFPRRVSGPELRSADRTSAARDRYGSWYWIDPENDTRIVVRNAGDGGGDTFWSTEAEGGSGDAAASGAFRPADGNRPASTAAVGALTITTDHRLVAAATGPDQLLVFDLHAGGPPQRIPWMGTGTFHPADATPRPEGGLYLLDRPKQQDADQAPRIWALDRTFRPEGRRQGAAQPVFRPRGETSSDGDATYGITPAPSIELSKQSRPRVIEGLPDDTLLVMTVGKKPGDAESEAASRVLRYRLRGTDGMLVDPETVNLSAKLKPASRNGTGTDSGTGAQNGADTGGAADTGDASGSGDIAWGSWQAYDVAFVPGSPGPAQSVRGTLYVVGRDGHQAYALHLSGDTDELTVSPKSQYIPLRRFSGKGIVAAGGDVYYDVDDRWSPLTAQPRPRFDDRAQVQSPPLDDETPNQDRTPFDSEISDCTWHRVFLDACIPTEADVRLEARASDRTDRLSAQPWQEQPAFYLREGGSEIPYHDPFPGDGERDGEGTWEVLLQDVEGRYLQLRLTLEGNGRTTPRIYALRAYYPRFSYLEEYLPDVYQEDETSARFVERFLAITEGTLTHLEGRIAAVQTLFDVRTVPDEYLDWLGTWFGASLDPALDARRKRLFLDHAVELFSQRGTLAGLARMLTLVLDPCADEFLFTPAGVADAVGRPDDATDRTARRQSVRLVEQFATRDVPRAAVGDARVPEQPTQVRVDQPWTPGDGADTLHRRFRTFLDRERYETTGDRQAVWGTRPSFPPLLPPSDDKHAGPKQADWRVFTRRVIDGPYAAIGARGERRGGGEQTDSVTQRFRAFLQRRYATVDQVPPTLRGRADRFEDVQLPSNLPSGTALRDWMQFVGAVLPIHRSAHRFRVLVPVDPDADRAIQRQRLDLARRVVETQKPAHTAFEVLPYWAAFRVGTVRTGLDTVLGRGSRYSPLLVGEGALAEETVGAAHPENVPDRRVVGRDAADGPRPL